MPRYNDLIQTLEKPLSNIFIYGLIDPDTNELKYIGQTCQGFHRIREHYYKCDKRNKLTNQLSYSKLWISELKKQNKIFKVIYIEYCDEILLDENEAFYIEYYRSLGCKLLNHFNGSQANRTKTVDKENRKIISIRTKEAMNTPEIKEKCRQHAYKTVAGYNKGKKFSQEFKDKISKAQKNVWYFKDPDGNIYRGMIKASKGIGCSISSLNNLVHGRAKTIYGMVIKYWRT